MTLSESSPTPSAVLGDRVATHCRRVRETLLLPLSPAARVRRVVDLTRELVREPVRLPSRQRSYAPQGHGRHLLHEDPETGFVVLAMAWPPGYAGPPHDHGTWGVVGVSEGTLEVTDYERDDDGSDPERATLTEVGRIVARPGDVASVLPPHRDFHRMGNGSRTSPAVSIHTYGRAIERCHVVEEGGRCRTIQLAYTTRFDASVARASASGGAFARIADEHADVRFAFQAIRVHLGTLRVESPVSDWDRLERDLKDFRTLLQRHFELEERSGFFRQVAELDAQSQAMVARLTEQHAGFLAQLGGVLSDLDPLKRDGRRLQFVSGELDNLWDNLRWHDAVEAGFLDRLASSDPSRAPS